MLKFGRKLAGERTFRTEVYAISFSSTSFTNDCVQNCSLIPRCSLSSVSQNWLPSRHVIPSSGSSESSGAGGLTWRGNRDDPSGTGRTPGWKTQTPRGSAQAWTSLLVSLYALCLNDFGLHSQLIFYYFSIRCRLSLEHLSLGGDCGAEVDPIFPQE